MTEGPSPDLCVACKHDMAHHDQPDCWECSNAGTTCDLLDDLRVVAGRVQSRSAGGVECSHMAPCTPTYRCAMHRKGDWPGRTHSVRVRLADAPTDVLCWLAQRPDQTFTPAEIAKAVAPPDADNPFLSTLDALHLLRDGLCVSERMNRWQATAEGRAAVVEAMTAPARLPTSGDRS